MQSTFVVLSDQSFVLQYQNWFESKIYFIAVQSFNCRGGAGDWIGADNRSAAAGGCDSTSKVAQAGGCDSSRSKGGRCLDGALTGDHLPAGQQFHLDVDSGESILILQYLIHLSADRWSPAGRGQFHLGVDTTTNQVDEREPVSNQLLAICTECKQAESQVEASQPSVVVPNQFVHYTLRCRDQLLRPIL